MSTIFATIQGLIQRPDFVVDSCRYPYHSNVYSEPSSQHKYEFSNWCVGFACSKVSTASVYGACVSVVALDASYVAKASTISIRIGPMVPVLSLGGSTAIKGGGQIRPK